MRAFVMAALPWILAGLAIAVLAALRREPDALPENSSGEDGQSG